MRAKRFWILGAGRFGKIAVERIACHFPDASITVVDLERSSMAANAAVAFVEQDGIAWLSDNLDGDSPVDAIVPAIPVHVAAQWVKTKLADAYDISSASIPDAWLSLMPNAMRGKGGQVFVSHADFICPDDCPEPKRICTHTGKPRPTDLYHLLKRFDFQDVQPLVIRSYQLLPGVGMLYPTDMIKALEVVRKTSHRLIMIATACRCHGVVDFMRLTPRRLG
jgi:hypothetical protein